MRVLLLLCLIAIASAKTIAIYENVEVDDEGVVKSKYTYLNGEKVREVDDIIIKRLLVDEQKINRLVPFGNRDYSSAVCETMSVKMMTYMVGASCYTNIMSLSSVHNKTIGIINSKAISWSNLLPGAYEEEGNKVRCYQDGLILATMEKMGRKILYIAVFDKKKLINDLTVVPFL